MKSRIMIFIVRKWHILMFELGGILNPKMKRIGKGHFRNRKYLDDKKAAEASLGGFVSLIMAMDDIHENEVKDD